jgi:hypothetical protein
MTDFGHRLVLKPTVGEPHLLQVARARKWILDDVGDDNADTYIDVWLTADERTEIHYVEDSLVGLKYVTVRGEEADSVAESIRTDCDLWTLPEALAALRAATTKDERLMTAYAVALTAAGNQDPAVVDAFRVLAGDPDEGIRQSVVVATGYLPWSALVELVRQLRDTDPVAHVRENAHVLLEGIERYGNGG